MKHKFLLINAINTSKEIETLFPPLGLGYLVSSLRDKFGPNYIEFKVVEKNIEQAINEFQPDIIGITSVTQNYNRAIEYASIAKQYGLPVVIGGIHISALPAALTNDMDVGVIGEGEQTIVELFNLFDTKGYFEANDLDKIEGIVFKKNGEIILTEKRKPILPLDKIPMPARDLLTIKSATYMFSSRGCPYRCIFCASSRFWGKVRFFSAEYIVKEIKNLVNEYHVKQITFYDDLFIADKNRLKQLQQLLEKEDILNRVSFGCHVRSNLVNDELAKLLNQLNVKGTSMGLESGVSTILEYLKGENISPDDHRNAVKILRSHGINPSASFIIGSPNESREDILQTLQFIKENRLTSFDVYVLTPFPGTPIWEYAKARKLVSDDMNWDILNVNFGENHNNAVILSERLDRNEIYELFKLFIHEKTKMIILNSMRNPLSLLKNPKSLTILLRKILSGKPLIGR